MPLHAISNHPWFFVPTSGLTTTLRFPLEGPRLCTFSVAYRHLRNGICSRRETYVRTSRSYFNKLPRVSLGKLAHSRTRKLWDSIFSVFSFPFFFRRQNWQSRTILRLLPGLLWINRSIFRLGGQSFIHTCQKWTTLFLVRYGSRGLKCR